MSPLTALNFKTPNEIWLGKLANYLNLKGFGCIAYAHTKQGKLEPRAFKCAFLGYFKGVKGYKLWYTNLQPLICIISKDVIFIETETLKSQASADKNIQQIPGPDESQCEVELIKNKDTYDKDQKELENINTDETVLQTT